MTARATDSLLIAPTWPLPRGSLPFIAGCGSSTASALPGARPDQKSFYKLYRCLKAVSTDRALAHAMAHLEERIVLFDQLRQAMRMAPKGASNGLNCDGGQGLCLKSIQKRVQTFRRRLLLRLQSSPDQGYQNMLAQIDQYWEKLFADPIEVQTQTGKLLIQPQRTNNAMERFFRSLKRALRRKSANASLAPSLRAMLADTPLVVNLRNPLYLKILLNGCSNLAQRFAQIDRRTVQIQMQKVSHNTHSIPRRLKKIIAQPKLLQTLTKLIYQCKNPGNPTEF